MISVPEITPDRGTNRWDVDGGKSFARGGPRQIVNMNSLRVDSVNPELDTPQSSRVCSSYDGSGKWHFDKYQNYFLKSRMSVPAEHRRRHMITLVSELRAVYGLPLEDARRVASMFVGLIEIKLKKGLDVDLGCCKISGKAIKPRQYKFNLGPEKGVVYQGESFKWSVKFSKAWLRKHKPKWSHV